MPLTRLDNLISSKTGKYLYVSPDDFNATDALDNRGNTPLRPFISIQRAFLEVARFSYLPDVDNDRFDQFSIMLAPGNHYIDNRPGTEDVEDLPIFQFNQTTGEWEANTNVSFDLSDPDNVLYKFNGRDGGATIPRGTSLVGTDLRRTQVRPLYVPDPADKDVPRTALFNVTGGCYFWQFTILDGELTSNSPLFNVGTPLGVGKVYTQPNDNTNLAIPEFSHHKITNFVFADKQDLGLLYRKIARCFSQYQPTIDDVYVEGSATPVAESWSNIAAYNVGDRVLYNGRAYVANQPSTNIIPSSNDTIWNELVIRNREFDYRVQENRIVGPLADAIRLDEVTIVDSTPPSIVTVKVRTKINHGFFPGQYVAVTNNGLNVALNGVFKVSSINPSDPKEFEYRVPTTATGLGLISGTTYTAASSPALDTNATVQAEIDSVESASPYVFNVSIRSVWGICGIWADGRKATGFKSMVIAQYTGVSLQKDDRAFIRYDEFSNTWNQAPLTDAFATTPYHIKGDAYWKDDWRNFHVRASDDSFIQNVSIFAVGFADHFLLESGGDMSITNSNSNFGNTSMHSVGYKGFAFNQDKGGYITDIIPPQTLASLREKKQQYYALDAQLTRNVANTSRLYIGSDDANDPEDRIAASISGYRIGAKRNELLNVKLDTGTAQTAELNPSGFERWAARLSTLNPTGLGVGDLDRDGTPDTGQDVLAYNLRQDAANLIDANKSFIQSEAFGYILEKYPYLQNIPYVNPNITSETGRYRDASNLILANRAEIIEYAYTQMATTFAADPVFIAGNDEAKCRRDIGYIVDAIAADLYNGGNTNIIEATRAYFDASGAPLSNGLVDEERFAIFAFNRAGDWCKKAISNLLTNTSLLDIASITSSGTTVTVVTNTPHGLVDNQKIDVGGATEVEYNGTQQNNVVVVDATTFTYTVSSAPSASPATGAYYISTITIDDANEIDPAGRYKDTYRLIAGNRTEIIDTAYDEIAIVHPTFVNPNPAKCKRDIGFIVDSIQQDLFWGGNEFIVGATKEYFYNGTPISNGLVGEVAESITAFNKARDMIKLAITNQLTFKDLDITADPVTGSNTDPASCANVQATVDSLTAVLTGALTAGNLNTLPAVDNGEWDCANVRNTIDTLTQIINTAIADGNLNSLPAENPGEWSEVSEASKCKRDIGYIVEALTADLRLGGNENIINAAEAYYTAIPLASDTTDGNPDGFTLDYIENERTETLDAWRYVRDLAISAMRNHNTYILNAQTTSGSAVVTVPSTVGLAVGMEVKSVNVVPSSTGSVNETNYNDEYEEEVDGRIVPKSSNVNSTIPSGAFIMKIGDGTNGLNSNQIQLGVDGSKFDSGTTVNATANGVSVNLFVQLNDGTWANAVEPSVDNNVIQDYNYAAAGDSSIGAPNGECVTVSNSIVTYFQIIDNIINNGVGVVPRVASTLSTGSLAQRATLFNLTEFDSSGNPTTNPHNMETGTPVRLVPRVREGANIDKRLVRLPKGFDTNTVYYVIAPGRITDPFDYSTSVGFDGANQQALLLATSEENAAAGIYVYSSETDSIDPSVEIDVYQYVLDIRYDLHQYQTTLANGSSTQLEVDRPHIFDIPADGITPQKVFFRAATDIPGSSLPALASSFGGGTVNGQVEYFVRYVNRNRFTVHETFENARDNLDPVTFQTGSTNVFYTFASKRRSPLKFAPEVGTVGNWYLETIQSTNQIIPRVKLSDYAGRARTTDSYFTRIEDTRKKEDRVYRLRYVIPKNLKTVRDPLNGFVLKIRTDETRKLLPQKILLKPTTTGANVARFNAPVTGERLGLTLTELRALDPNFVSTYDPSPQGNPKRIETDSKIAFTIQSARKVNILGTQYLQLTVFDIGVDDDAYKAKLFTSVKISVPQGGNGEFVGNVADLPPGNNSNVITWEGNCSGSARVHGYYEFEGQHYLILKDLTGNSTVDYDNNTVTTFTQGSVTATLLGEANDGRSDIANNLYVVDGANAYTMTPGDTLNDDNGVSYTIASIEDASDMEDTFYIFDIDTIRRRIPDQQDGIYYLTCLRGNISPFPTGSGVGTNFRKFKFSQPVSKLYPEFYKNDPEWYKGIDVNSVTLLDPPPTVSAADNYVHGLVTVNDAKRSVTKEMVLDFVADAGTGNYQYSGTNTIQAQSGSASAGSEGRRIPIAGDSDYPLEQKLYVELRRPSIARSGNHTFEYLGFGPGNYSTGFPVRQEVVLTDVQDFYAQAKREDAGIVFYTGLNSNGDLYIGNRKINAITGEETFLESAALVESADEADDIGTLVTTFETPVTFLDIITVNGGDGDKESFFQSPVVINNQVEYGVIPNFASLTIRTGDGTNTGYDPYLQFNVFGRETGNIMLHQNTIRSAVYDFNARGGQGYSFRTGLDNTLPDFNNTYGADQASQTDFGLNINKGTEILSKAIKTGDIIFKGSETQFTGSIGWLFASAYQSLTRDGVTPQVLGIEGSPAGTLIRINLGTGVTNNSLGITTSTQVKIAGALGNPLARVNGVWNIYSDATYIFAGSNNYFYLAISSNLPVSGLAFGYAVSSVAQPSIDIAISRSAFKEFGVIGAEALRTETETPGNFKLGINTIARAPHSAYRDAFVSAETTPRANLDVVGNAFISGKTVDLFASEPGTTRTLTLRDNALLVGGDSATPASLATFRVATSNNGRVGINTDVAGLDRTLVVVGDGRITSDFFVGGNLTIGTVGSVKDMTLSGDLAVNGGDLTSTSANFNLLNNTSSPTLSLNFAGNATLINVGHLATASQTINIGTAVTDSQTIEIGTSATNNHSLEIGTSAIGTTLFDIHSASTDSTIRMGIVPIDATSRSIVEIGGGTNPTSSIFRIRNVSTILSGNLQINGNTLDVNPVGGVFNFIPSSIDELNIGTTTGTINLAGTAGTTTVNNSLQVNSKLTVESNIQLNGGLANSAVDVDRNILGQLRISTVSRNASNVATIVTTVAHNLSAGDRVEIQSSDTSYDTSSPVSVTIIDTVTFTYSNTGSAEATKSATGTIQRYNSAGDSIGYAHNAGSLAATNVDYYSVSDDIADFVPITALSSNKLLVNNHYFNAGDAVRFTDTGNLAGVNTSTTYYILSPDNSGFFLTLSAGAPSPTVPISFVGSATDPGTAEIKLEATRLDNPGGGEFVGLLGNIATVERNSNIATVVLTTPLPTSSIATGGYIQVVDCSEIGFNTDPVLVTVVNTTTLRYPSIGVNVSTTSVTAGRLLNSSLYVNNPSGIGANEFLRVGKEIVRTTSGASTVTPFIVPVLRAQEGTALITHNDGRLIRKLTRTINATFVSATATATDPRISLEEFGGSIAIGDYLRIDKNTVNEEWVQISNIVAANAQKFIVNTGIVGDDVFEILSTTGDTNIRGDVTIGTPTSVASAGSTGGGNLRVHNSIELFGNSSSSTPDKQYFVVTDGTSPKLYISSDSGNTRIYDGGDFEIFSDSFFGSAGGTFDKTRVDSAVNLKFQVEGSTGNAASAGTLRVVGDTTLGGVFTIRDGVSVGSVGTGAIRFRVDSAGDTFASRFLTVDGESAVTASPTIEVLSVKNLGDGGSTNNDFVIKQDRSIKAFGHEIFYNANGGRRAVYLSNTGSSDLTAPVLESNTNYFVRPTSTLVVKLPTNAITGDIIRIVDIAGNLNFNVTLVVRATGGTRVQGSTGGSRLGGLPSPYSAGGELVVNTPNAAFGLIYLGPTDSEGNTPAASEQGWYIMDI